MKKNLSMLKRLFSTARFLPPLPIIFLHEPLALSMSLPPYFYALDHDGKSHLWKIATKVGCCSQFSSEVIEDIMLRRAGRMTR